MYDRTCVSHRYNVFEQQCVFTFVDVTM